MAYGLTCCDGHVELEAAVRAYRSAQARLPRAEERAAQLIAQARADVDQARAELAAAIVEADAGGVRQRDIVAATGYSREHIRRILKSGDS